MILAESISQLKELVATVKNLRKGFLTNFYLDEFKHNIWIQHRDLWYEQIGETCFLIKKSEDFWNVFYCTTTLDEFQRNLQEFTSKYTHKPLLFDIVGRDVQCGPMLDLFKSVGFEQVISLVRMNRMTAEEEEYVDDATIDKATDDDVNKVNMLLHQFFDGKTEQIPYMEELEAYSKFGHVLVCHEGGNVSGFLIFEMNTTTLYLRYWFTHPDYRDQKVGSRLLRRFFKEGKTTKRQLLWVIQTNENAIKRYRHYGFKEENMFDYVMRYN